MRSSSRWATARRVGFATALVLAPAAQSLQDHLTPERASTLTATLAVAAAHPGAFAAATLFGLLAAALYAGVFLGLFGLAREHAPAFAHVGVLLGVVGVLGFFSMHVVYLVIASFASSGVTADAIGPALDALERSSPVGAIVALSFFIGMFGGMLLLAIALWRSRAAPRGAVALVFAFLLLDSGVLRAVGLTGSRVGLALHLLLLLALGWIAVHVVRKRQPADSAGEAGPTRA